ncbi:energy-coupling factor transporter transmembrane protein EcfT [Microbacterium sp. AK009]|uniref:hypothetical protein n=1 Tax=Microbacterium sp. AK009 TaxID=2723068 RepID=UPI0015C6CB80|nr:hypothetical protein [Microbacterium sp. AK009]NYF18304.1 energy-coupling factor transporter transmembrane protein EcfT [Microbacterium sp. AK009]
MNWDMRLPGAGVLNIVLPLMFGVLAVLTVALPARVSVSTVLAPAALVLWLVWLLWAYPRMTYRRGSFTIMNPLRTVSFTASAEVTVSGTGVPRLSHGRRSIRPVVLLVSPGGAVGTMRANQGVSRGVNVVRMETLAPGHEANPERAASVLQNVCARAGDQPANYIQRWNGAAIVLTLALVAWAATTVLE